MTAMKFVLARRLGTSNTNIDDKEKERNDSQMNEEHNLFNMPQQQDQNNQDIPPEDKVIDVNEDVILENDTSENENQNNNVNNNNVNNENVKDESERNGENMGEILNLERQDEQDVNTNTNWENEEREDQEIKDRMRNVNNTDREEVGNKQGMGEKNNEEKDIWKFSDVSVVPRNNKPYKYNLILNGNQLSELYSSGKIFYDPSIQRGSRINKKGEEKPLIYSSNVKLLLSKMLDGSMDAGTILLNFSKEYPNQLVYNSQERTLSGKGELAIIDAAHRLEALKIWCRKFKRDSNSIKNPSDFYFPVTIFNETHNGAKNIFVESNARGKSISKTRIAFHDVYNPNRMICERLSSESELKGKIENISSTIKKASNAIITYKTLLDGISSFKVATSKEAEEVSNFLINYWNGLINLFPQAMGRVDTSVRQEQRERSFVIENLWINAYFVLAQKLINDPDWKTKLHRLTENDFLSRSNSLWQKILIDGKIVNRSSTSKFVQEKTIDYVVNGKSIEELMSEK